MVTLKHELWEDPEGLDTVCLAGPDGDEARSLLPEGSRLVLTFEAGSHYEAMTKYHEFRGLGEYKTDHEWDHQPYPEDWAARQ